jgi:hypothetical protein
MKHRLAALALAISLAALVGTAQEKKEPAKKDSASLTGCVDEQDGQYLLIDPKSRDPIASLVADGFPTEGFAKHLGHKVTVRGTSSPGTGRPVFKVRTVDTVSEMCTPDQR